MSETNPPSRRRQIEEFIFIRIPHVLSGVLFLLAVVLNVVWARRLLTRAKLEARRRLEMHGGAK